MGTTDYQEMRVKICGIRNLEDAGMAIAAGADALGFLVGLDYRTNDELDAGSAGALIAALPPFISSVLVTHKADISWVANTCRALACTTVQLHGDFAVEQIPSLRERIPLIKVIKAIHVTGESAIHNAQHAAKFADAVLLDSKTATRIGGTGTTHDWSISARIVQALGKPVILSGGLNPENVRQAVTRVNSFAVDVNSGVEDSDGSKSMPKLLAFIRKAKVRSEYSSETAY